jgi:Tfp pilus assembly protein PilF
MAPTTPKLSECPETEGSLSIRKLAQHYLTQGQTCRAAALMRKLAETEPAPENLTLLAEIYTAQGLFDDAAALYLRVVKASLK